MIPRPAALLCPALAAAALLVLPACQAPQLPEGYTWNVTTQEQNDIKTPRGAFRWGFDQGRINENIPAASRDRYRYDYASAMPNPGRGYQGAPAAYGSAATPTPASTYGTPVTPQPYNDLTLDLPAAPAQPAAAAGSFRATPTYQVVAPAPVTPTPAPKPAYRTHTIQKDDNYWDLAKQYYGKGSRFLDIQNANPGLDPVRLQIGTEIVIPD